MNDDDLLPPQPSQLKARLALLAAVLAGLTLIGGIGQLSGAGWFAHRTILWGEGDLYILNMGSEPFTARVDGGKAVEVPPQDAQILSLIGGTSHVELTDKTGALIAAHDITIDGSNALIKVGDELCLSVADITPYYGGKGNPEGIPIHEVVPAAQSVWIAHSRNVVWPRRDFPKRLAGADGPARWVEIVGCDLIEDRTFLSGFLEIRLQERLKKLKAPAAP
jgi:hypothetical protein